MTFTKAELIFLYNAVPQSFPDPEFDSIKYRILQKIEVEYQQITPEEYTEVKQPSICQIVAPEVTI